jgi:hypothetical protein
VTWNRYSTHCHITGVDGVRHGGGGEGHHRSAWIIT